MEYQKPTYEKLEASGKNNFFVRLCYGYVEHTLGMDTEEMTTREVIQEFLDAKGLKSPREFFDKKFKKDETTENKTNESSSFEAGSDDLPNVYDEKTSELFNKFRQDRSKLRHEEGMVVRDGVVLSDKKGNSGSVAYSPHETARFSGARMIHNHPQGNTFLSDEDVYFLSYCDLNSIEASGYDGTNCIVSIDNYIKKPRATDYNNPAIYLSDYDKWKEQQKRVNGFLQGYKTALNDGLKEANEVWNGLPKQKVKTGKYFVNIPEGWNLYTKGASPRDKMNYKEYAEIVQKHIIEFNKTAKKYGITSVIERK